jgi:hypothetical protein
VTEEASIVAAFDAIAHAEGRIDSLVNNAGMAIRRSVVDVSLADWNRVVEVNMTGVFLCARSTARHMLPAGRGAIVKMSSIMGFSGGGLYPNISYQTTKGAVVNLTRALAVEWAGQNICVNAIAPTGSAPPLSARCWTTRSVLPAWRVPRPWGAWRKPTTSLAPCYSCCCRPPPWSLATPCPSMAASWPSLKPPFRRRPPLSWCPPHTMQGGEEHMTPPSGTELDRTDHLCPGAHRRQKKLSG